MSKKCKAIITSIMVVLYIILFSYNSTSNAMSVTKPFTSLFSQSNWWCTGQGIWLKDTCSYTAEWKKYKIVGGHFGEDTDGDGIGDWVYDWGWAYDPSAKGTYEGEVTAKWDEDGSGTYYCTCETSSKKERQLAYILATGDGHTLSTTGGTAQNNFWKVDAASELGYYGIAEAQANPQKARITLLCSGVINCDNNRIGPLRVDYYGEVCDMSVEFDNNDRNLRNNIR